MTTQKPVYCNKFDPRPNGGDARYAFVQAASETTEMAVLRAAQKVLDVGINKAGQYESINHTAANNAAFAFDSSDLEQIATDDNQSRQVRLAAKFLMVRQAQVNFEQAGGQEAQAQQCVRVMRELAPQLAR